MNKRDLMIGDVVNSPKDLKRMVIRTIEANTVTLVPVEGNGEVSERAFSEIDPIVFFDERIFKALGFTIRPITLPNQETMSERILQLFDPMNSSRFFTLIVSSEDDLWKVKISDNNFKDYGMGYFKYVSELQNIVRACTGLEFNIFGL